MLEEVLLVLIFMNKKNTTDEIRDSFLIDTK